MRDALWRGRAADEGIDQIRNLATTLAEAIPSLSAFYATRADTARCAAMRLLDFLQNNAAIIVDYALARKAGRRISTAPAESVMNHLINRRMSKRQQMRWSVKGAHLLLQTRVDLLDGRLVDGFKKRFEHFRSPEMRATA